MEAAWASSPFGASRAQGGAWPGSWPGVSRARPSASAARAPERSRRGSWVGSKPGGGPQLEAPESRHWEWRESGGRRGARGSQREWASAPRGRGRGRRPRLVVAGVGRLGAAGEVRRRAEPRAGPTSEPSGAEEAREKVKGRGGGTSDPRPRLPFPAGRVAGVHWTRPLSPASSAPPRGRRDRRDRRGCRGFRPVDRVGVEGAGQRLACFEEGGAAAGEARDGPGGGRRTASAAAATVV